MSAGPSRTRTFLLKAGLPSAHVGVPVTLTVAGRAGLSAGPPQPVAVASNTHLKFPCAFPLRGRPGRDTRLRYRPLCLKTLKPEFKEEGGPAFERKVGFLSLSVPRDVATAAAG